MRVITCTGYHGTGSSAIGDLLSEFQNVDAKSAFEPSFLHYSFGVSDLEYSLIENPDRHSSSFSLNNFIRYANIASITYNKFFNGAWTPSVDAYVKSLTIASFSRYRSRLVYIQPKCKRYLAKLIEKSIGINFQPRENYFCTITDDDLFIEATHRFVRNLLLSIHDNREFLFIDQLFPSSNIARFYRYVDFPVKTIIVDRDPRDLYLQEKYILKDNVTPIQSPEVFCTWYKHIRATQKDELKLDDVTLIRFEDMIYRYEQTISKIASFIGLDSKLHIQKGERFNPWSSIRNTRLWEKYQKDREAIAFIETELKEYLYPYREEDIELHRKHVK